jgi:TonB family protein
MESRKDVRTYTFILISIFTHLALAIGVLTLNTSSQKKKPEATSVEVLSAEGTASAVETDQAPVLAENSKPAEAPQIAPQEAAPKAVASASLPAKLAPATEIINEASSHAVSTQAVSTHAVSTHVAPSVAEESPTTEESDVAVSTSDESPSETDQVTESVDPALAAQEDISRISDEALREKEAQAEALRQETLKESEKLAQEQKTKYEQQREALATAAAERMAQEAQAERQAEEARQAEAARQAEEARIAEQNRTQNLSGSAEGTGSGDVRTLSELKQIPGNQRPQYDSEDRFKGRQGEVAFLAYVSPEGRLTEFKILQSSGHRELDAKTLKAIRDWKFYPGQEGWVEIPFKWDLKGGPQEMPTGLRRRAQVSPNTDG